MMFSILSDMSFINSFLLLYMQCCRLFFFDVYMVHIYYMVQQSIDILILDLSFTFFTIPSFVIGNKVVHKYIMASKPS